jgi:hypothetical protein
MSGETFTEEERKLILNKEHSEKNYWELIEKFQKKKWFFEYISQS